MERISETGYGFEFFYFYVSELVLESCVAIPGELAECLVLFTHLSDSDDIVAQVPRQKAKYLFISLRPHPSSEVSSQTRFPNHVGGMGNAWHGMRIME
ncbi:hypothetical protein C0J52_19468 [Blattella germanica]|nr:hypothetical protein C0J52_19468 [Blattella germanica]